jgi:hypothetical protein
MKKKRVDVKSNADGTATVRRRKNRVASKVPLEEGACGRKQKTIVTARRGVGSSSRSVRGGRGSARRGSGQGSGVPNVTDEEELQLSDFSITDDDEYLFTTDVLLKKDYKDNWWGKFVGAEHHANIAHEEGEELISLDESDDDGTSRRSKSYREFNENHDIRIPIELEKGLMFANTRVFKRAIK